MEKVTQRELEEMLTKAKSLLDTSNIKYGTVTKLSINSRAKSRFGQCRKRNGLYEIEVSNFALVDRVKTFNTLVHELLHTVNGCMNHGSGWQNLASRVNREHGLNITTRSTASEEQKAEKKKMAKYVIHCTACDMDGYAFRKSKVVTHTESFKCKCGGSLKVDAL